MKKNRSSHDRDRGPRAGRDGGRAHSRRPEHRHVDERRPQNHRRLQVDGPLIIGRNTVREVLLRRPELVARVFITAATLDGADGLGALLHEQNIPHLECQASELSTAAASDSHQGVLAVLKKRHHPELSDLLEQALRKPRALILIADSIYDPHNLGAILRASECFGVDAVVISKNRGTGITPAVTKSAVGASEFVPVCIVSNLAQSLRRAIDAGFVGIAADVGPEAVGLSKVEFPPHAVLVLGSEGEVVQPLLRSLCELKVTIPMRGVIDSLNVSQAAAVFAYAWQAQG